MSLKKQAASWKYYLEKFDYNISYTESILIGHMISFNIPLSFASGVAVSLRLWFLAGEAFIFLFALLRKLISKKKVK